MGIINLQEEKMIRELPVKSKLEQGYDWLIVEGKDGTKKMKVEDFLANSLRDNLFFDSVEDLCSANNITEGSMVYTKGFKYPGDGGAARYEIKYDPGTSPNNYTILSIKNRPVLKAYLTTDSFITPEQIGANGNGVDNDTEYIKKLLTLDCPIMFNPCKKYRIKENISIPSDTYIDFNGTTFVLDNCTIVCRKSNNTTLTNLNIESSNNGKGIYIYQSKALTLINCNIYGIQDRCNGIEIADSDSISIIDSNFINGSTFGRGIFIHGEDFNYPIQVNNISITNCNFDSVKECIYLGGLIEVGSVSIANCRFKYNNKNSGNIAITNAVSKASVIISNIKVVDGYEVLSVEPGSKSFIGISDIDVEDTHEVYNLNGSLECVVSMTGNHNYIMKTENTNNNGYLFGKINTTLLLTASSFNIKSYIPLNNGYIHCGFINDSSDTKNNMLKKRNENLESTTGTLYIKDFGNAYINITGTENVLVIERGINGQIIELVSDKNLLLKDLSHNIVLLEPGDITLHKYKGVKLIYVDGKWIQIQ